MTPDTWFAVAGVLITIGFVVYAAVTWIEKS